MAKIEYTPLNLPKALVEELKIWRLVHGCVMHNHACNLGCLIAYEIANMINSQQSKNCRAFIADPGVVDELGRILEKHPELYDKMVVYNHTPGQDAEQQS